jgi:endoglucanase
MFKKISIKICRSMFQGSIALLPVVLLLCMLFMTQCAPTGRVSGYSWKIPANDVFGGKSLFDLMETPSKDMKVDISRAQDYIDFFDYPGSRDKIEMRYDYRLETVTRRAPRAGSGINLNGLDAPREGDWNGSVVAESDFDIIKNAGFKIVRLPVRFNTHMTNTDPVTVNKSYLQRLDRIINSLLQRDLIVILDVHHFLDSNSLSVFSSEKQEAGVRSLFLRLWDILAARYRDYPGGLYFELLNEPFLPFSRAVWNELLNETLKNIRQSGGNNLTRKIIVGCGTWSHIGALASLQIPTVREDPNLIVTFHYYEPMSFTHQGAPWGPQQRLTGFWKGNVWTGSEYQKKLVNEDFDLAALWAKEHGRQIFLGEFGTIQFADKTSRVCYTRYIREQAEARGFLWAYWSYNAHDWFGICQTSSGKWKMELLDALIPADR